MSDICHSPFRYTSSQKGNDSPVVYAIVLTWPAGNQLQLGAPSVSGMTKITLLGFSGPPFDFTADKGQGVSINIHPFPLPAMPCQWAWVFCMEKLSNG